MIFNKNIFLNTCRTQDDIWFYLIRIANKINAFITNNQWTDSKSMELNSKGLYYFYNRQSEKNNYIPYGFKNVSIDIDPNTKALKNTLILLKNKLT